MPSCLRRLLFVTVLFGLAVGCVQRPSTRPRGPASALSVDTAPEAATAADARLRAARVTRPGMAYTRAEPAAPFDPSLVVTTQVAHGDIFVHAFSGSGPRYVAVERLYRGQQAFILPFARNYGRAADGRTDLTYEITIRKPDGTHDGAPFSSQLWQQPVSGPRLILYPSTNVSFYAEPLDPLGDYVITARITDHLSGETKELGHTLRLLDYARPDLPAGFDAQTWFHRYYQQPTPELALPALPRLFLELPADRRVNALPSLLGFYDQLLTDNAWLLPAFSARLAAGSPDEAYVLSLILGHHLRAAPAAPAGIDFATWVRLEDFRAHPWPDDTRAPLQQAAQLDSLWGRFLASGLYTPVERVLSSLQDHADLGAADRWQKLRAETGQPADLSPETLAAAADPDFGSPADLPPGEVLRDVFLRTALWSLRSHARQHMLVRAYLDWTLQIGDLPAAQKDLLERILRPDTAAAAAAP